jgi:AcrR family transcriptional regulator
VVGGVRDRRAALVAAAYHRVAAVGFEGLRLRQVADDVGIDHSTLHHHVATKQELIEAVADYTVRQFFPTSPQAPGVGLRGHLAALRTLMVARPELLTVTAELDLRARRDPAVAAVMARFEADWRAVLAGALRDAVVDAERAAELVVAAVKGVRLAPERAAGVFDDLALLLLGPDTDAEDST